MRILHDSRSASRPRLDPEVLAERSDSDHREQDLAVPTDLSCWPGHFPEQPILPGVLEIDWAMKLLSTWVGGDAWPRRIERLKFKQLVRPGEKLTLALEREASGGAFRFQFTRGGTPISLGRLVLEPAGNLPGDAGNGPPPEPSSSSSFPAGSSFASVAELPPVAQILPQSGAMVLLDRVASHARSGTVCSARIGEHSIFTVPSGAVPAWMGLEYMSQCIAAHAGLLGREHAEPPRVGFLVGTRCMTLRTRRFRSGQTLIVQAGQCWGGTQGMVAFDGSIRDADSGALLADGRLNCFIPGHDAVAGDA